VSFEETPDYREFLDTQTLYQLRLVRVSDQDTRIGQALRWEFSVLNRADGTPVVDGDDKPIVISRLTSPKLGPRSRARAFVNRLFGHELAKDELRVLIQSGQLANQLKGKTALGYIVFTDADGNETEFPKVNELFPVDVTKPGKKLPGPPRSYEEVFDDDEAPSNNDTQSDNNGDLPFR